MKRVFFLIILGIFFISCRALNPIGAVGETPIPAPSPIRLSPINAGNAGPIQMVYAIHVGGDAHAEDLLAISPDKKWVAQTAKDGAPLHVQRLNWTPDGSFVPMGNGFTTFFLYQTTSLAFSPDSMHFAVANEADNTVMIFGLDDLPNETKKTVLPIGDRAETVTFTKDSRKLIVGTWSSLQLWDLGTASLEREISANALDGVCSAAVSPDGKILAASSCTNFDISTWEVDNNYAPLSQLAGSCAEPCPAPGNIFAFNPVTGEIASIADFPRFSIQDPRTGKNSATLTTQPAGNSLDGGYSLSTLAFTSDGAILAMAANQELQLIDAKNGNLLWHHKDPKPITAVAISDDSMLMISIDSDGELVFWGILGR